MRAPGAPLGSMLIALSGHFRGRKKYTFSISAVLFFSAKDLCSFSQEMLLIFIFYYWRLFSLSLSLSLWVCVCVWVFLSLSLSLPPSLALSLSLCYVLLYCWWCLGGRHPPHWPPSPSLPFPSHEKRFQRSDWILFLPDLVYSARGAINLWANTTFVY